MDFTEIDVAVNEVSSILEREVGEVE